MATRQFGPYRPLRPFRDGLVDGDDVWPPLAVDDLRLLAAIDLQIAQGERARAGLALRRAADEAGGAVYSVAERVRHYRDLVERLESGVAEDYELLTELHCRDVVEMHVRELPMPLRRRLDRELLGALDERFRAATEDDGGEFLRARFPDSLGLNWRWSRRPRTAPTAITSG